MKILRNKLFPVFFAVFLLLIGGAAQAAPSAAGSIGYADFMYLINQHPDTLQANAQLQTEQAAAKQEYESKASGLNDKEKLELDRQLGSRLEKKRLELLKPISDKVAAAANEIMKEKGLTIIISKNDVIAGGVDITNDVLKKISGR